MNEKKKHGKKKLFISIAVALVIGSIVFFYVKELNDAVKKNMQVSVAELAEHDIKSIRAYIGMMWDSLGNIQERMNSYHCDTVEQTQERMNLECATSDFEFLCLVAEDGTVYTDKYMTYSRNELDVLSFFSGGKDKTIGIFNDKMRVADIKREMVLYGVRLNDYEIDGIKFVAMAGMCSKESVSNFLSVSVFEGSGYSGVIDHNGNYLVSEVRTTALNRQDNLFTRLRHGKFIGGNSIEAVREKLVKNETFSFQYLDTDGVRKDIYCKSIDGMDLTFLMIIPANVLVKQIMNFVVMSMVILFVFVIILIAVFIFLYYSSQRVNRISAETKVRNEFLTNMSHEIRTPLNGLIGLNHLSRVHIDNKDKLEKYLDKMQSTATYLLSLVNDVLDVAKFQSGKVEVIREPMCIDTIMDEIWSMQYNNVHSRGVEFLMNRDISFPFVMGDEVRVKQVLMNIIGNAAKFTPEGGKITVSVTQQEEDANCVMTTFTCTDTGCGMSPKYLEHIWEAFSQDKNSDSAGVKGTGLGMTISNLLVRAMGGEIYVESELGKGSTFTVILHSEITKTIPDIVESHTQYEEGTEPEAEDSGREKKKSFHILVAEDVELNAEILVEILQQEGFTVDHAANGREAVEMFRQSPPGEYDIILMDMQMPIMDGCTASMEIRKLDRPDAKTVVIFACTANTFQEDRDKAMKSGMDGFLSKPIRVSAMLNKLERTLRGK